MSKNDPYHDRKVYHMAKGINAKGEVSALCFNHPRPINLKIALWTIQQEAVTCPKCLKLLNELESHD